MQFSKTPIRWEGILIALTMLCIITTTSGQVTPQTDFNQPLNASLLREDFQAFRKVLAENHPDMYRYRSRGSLNRLLDSCEAAINAPITLIGFGNLVRFAVSALECGHTSGSLPGEIMERYAASVPMFPLKVWFSGDHAFVLCSRNENVPAGAEILSIDGVSLAQIHRRLLQYLPSDGKIQTKKNATLNNDAFIFLYNFIYGPKTSYNIQLVTPEGQSRGITLEPARFENTGCPAYKTGNNTRPLDIAYPGQSKALLTIRTFSKQRIMSAGQDFPAFLETTFGALRQKQIKNLIIDLRGNGGGDDVYGALLYAYLTGEPFRYFSALRSLSKPVMTADDHPGLAVQQPAGLHFQGNVYVLTDGRTFSTAADFCAIAKSNARAVFIGEETGGGYEGNNSGGSVRVGLPHSGLQVAVPTIRYSNAVKPAREPGRGILPEYPVVPSISDALAQRDPPLQKALELAAGK